MSSITCAVDLLAASYRGVSFWVKSDKEEYGRRIVHHEYPNSDTPFNEDLGEKFKKYAVDGYVVGDNSFADKEAVVAACRMRGAALLQLPAVPAFMAVCTSLAVDRDKDDQGRFVVKMEFVADPVFGNPIDVPIFESLISGVMTTVSAALSAVYYASFGAVDALPYVANNVVNRVQTFADRMRSTIENIPGSSSSSRMAQAMTDTIGVYQAASVVARPDASVATSLNLVTTLGDIFYNVVTDSAPADALIAMLPLCSFSVAEAQDSSGAAQYGSATPVVTYSGNVQSFDSLPAQNRFLIAFTGSAIAPSEVKDAANAAAFNGVVRSYALIAYAQAAAATAFTDRKEAIQVRANLAELFDQQLERTSDYDVAIALTTARDYAVRSISQRIASIIPLVVVECSVSLPSLYWAARLYNDASRAEELSDRNSVPTPAFMPQRFEALRS